VARRATLALSALVAASLLSVATVLVRAHETGDSYYRFLLWNLVLAWIPLVFAISAYVRARKRDGAVVVLLLVPWLLFFPNAPYLLTDFVHLGEGPAPLWYDGLMLSAFAWTGLLLGFASLYLVQMILRSAFGGGVAWLGVVLALCLASVGVYVGRFIGLNSWDALLHPVHVAEILHDQVSAVPLRMGGALMALAGFLGVAYLVVYSVTGLELRIDREQDSDLAEGDRAA
jgi:uncharacterized membrane protein